MQANNINYNKVTQRLIESLDHRPVLLLHSCCAPCSSYCLEWLNKHFDITVFYYNPNIYPAEEYCKRLQEQYSFVQRADFCRGVKVVDCGYEPREFYDAVKGLEQLPEGGARCEKCFRLRLRKTAEKARELGAEYFTTTLSISPLKDSRLLNQIGGELAEEYGIKYLYSDFKKNDGYRRSTQISAEYGMYRQDYCGCVFSFNERKKRKSAEN